MIILIGSNKGGCGKSTTVINLAHAFKKEGKEVLIIDADKQSTTSRWGNDRENNKHQPNITIIKKYDNLKPALDEIKKKYDIILIDVAGRNSREMITAMLSADLLICPLQCSQPDLDTLNELHSQVKGAKDFNKKLKTYIYHTLASTNLKVRDKERNDFKTYIAQFNDFQTLNSISYFRKAYKDAISEGKTILELNNREANNELKELHKEIKTILQIK